MDKEPLRKTVCLSLCLGSASIVLTTGEAASRHRCDDSASDGARCWNSSQFLRGCWNSASTSIIDDRISSSPVSAMRVSHLWIARLQMSEGDAAERRAEFLYASAARSETPRSSELIVSRARTIRIWSRIHARGRLVFTAPPLPCAAGRWPFSMPRWIVVSAFIGAAPDLAAPVGWRPESGCPSRWRPRSRHGS